MHNDVCNAWKAGTQDQFEDERSQVPQEQVGARTGRCSAAGNAEKSWELTQTCFPISQDKVKRPSSTASRPGMCPWVRVFFVLHVCCVRCKYMFNIFVVNSVVALVSSWWCFWQGQLGVDDALGSTSGGVT